VHFAQRKIFVQNDEKIMLDKSIPVWYNGPAACWRCGRNFDLISGLQLFVTILSL
jgi:hypothetical protein